MTVNRIQIGRRMLSGNVRFALLFSAMAFRIVEIGTYLVFFTFCHLLMGVRLPFITRPRCLGISSILAFLQPAKGLWDAITRG